MLAIADAVGERAISHYSNVVVQRPFPPPMTEEEFNDFWRGTYEGHAPSRERYLKRLAEECKAFQDL